MSGTDTESVAQTVTVQVAYVTEAGHEFEPEHTMYGYPVFEIARPSSDLVENDNARYRLYEPEPSEHGLATDRLVFDDWRIRGDPVQTETADEVSYTPDDFDPKYKLAHLASASLGFDGLCFEPTQIERAWRQLALRIHPDKIQDPEQKANAQTAFNLIKGYKNMLLENPYITNKPCWRRSQRGYAGMRERAWGVLEDVVEALFMRPKTETLRIWHYENLNEPLSVEAPLKVDGVTGRRVIEGVDGPLIAVNLLALWLIIGLLFRELRPRRRVHWRKPLSWRAWFWLALILFFLARAIDS